MCHVFAIVLFNMAWYLISFWQCIYHDSCFCPQTVWRGCHFPKPVEFEDLCFLQVYEVSVEGENFHSRGVTSRLRKTLFLDLLNEPCCCQPLSLAVWVSSTWHAARFWRTQRVAIWCQTPNKSTSLRLKAVIFDQVVQTGCTSRLKLVLFLSAPSSEKHYKKKGFLFQNSLKVTCQIQYVNRSSSLILGPSGKNLFWLPQDYIKKLEQERFESDIREAHEVLAHMGSRLHSLEHNDQSVWSPV